MNYKDIKASIAATIESYLDGGQSREQAEHNVLDACVGMFERKKLGFMDLKYAFQVTGYDFSGKLAETMEGIKAAIRSENGFDELIEAGMECGKTEAQVAEQIIQISYEAFQKGDIKEPEKLDVFLWSLGYRLTDGFLLANPETQKAKIAYVLDN